MFDIFKHTLFANGWLKAWAIYLMAFPFYFFPAGSAQPSDLYIVLIIGIYIAFRGFKLYSDNTQVLVKFLRFCFYLIVVNFGVYIALMGGTNKGLPWFVISAFYIYNLLVMAFALSLYRQYGKQFLVTTVYACILAAILQIALSVLLGTSGDGVRGMMFFKNPNQLGYYSLCGLAIVLSLQSMVKIPRIIVFLSFFLFSYLAIVSVSKAAIGSIIILFAAYFIANRILSLNNILVLIVVGGIGSLALLKSEFGSNFQRSLEVREINEGDRPDEISEWQYRGYDRIEAHPGYLILGAGEGGYNRFEETSFIGSHEIHSSIGTIVFCYGIPGTILFILFVFSLLKKLPWYYVIYSLPLFAYGLTHMGLRFTIFWVALVMFPIIRVEIRKKQYILKKRRLETSQNYNRTIVPEISPQGTI